MTLADQSSNNSLSSNPENGIEDDSYMDNIPLPEDTDGINPNDIEVSNESTVLASSQGKNVLIFILLVIASITIIYFAIFNSDQPEKELTDNEKKALRVPKEAAQEVTQDASPPKVNFEVVTPITSNNDAATDSDIVLPQLDNETNNDNFFPEPTLNIEPAIPEPITPNFADDPETPTLPEVDQTNNSEIAELPALPEESQEPEDEETEEDSFEDKPLTKEQLQAQQQEKYNRRSASMVIVNGFNSENETLSEGEIAATSAEQINITRVGRLDFLIAQGKIIDAVLETGINTDLPGILRAIVSRDVYAESSKNILVPRGSRLIGTYNADVVRRQKRIDVIWTRLIHPDGIDIALDSPTADQLGRSGLIGDIDNKYAEMLGNSALVTAIGILSSAGLSSLSNADNVSSSTTQNTDGSSTTNEVGSLTDLELSSGITDFRSKVETVAQSFLEEQPTITVDQGAKIKVFVNKDILFPPSIANSVRSIP